MEKGEIRKLVRDRYAGIVREGSSCCGPEVSCCSGPATAEGISGKTGYSEEELKSVPQGSNLGLGCGNPTALASLKEGEVVLDLGSGAGFDCFLAANQVGEGGKVIGVDMTPEMLDRARQKAAEGGYTNVEFRLGEIENIPAADGSVDVVISNCVINLSPDKRRVFKEALRVLKPGGRMMISDIVLEKELPERIKSSIESYVGCVSGAMLREEYLAAIRDVGFGSVEIISASSFPVDLMAGDPLVREMVEQLEMPVEELREVAGSIFSVQVQGIREG